MTELWYFSTPICQPCKFHKPTVTAFGEAHGIPVRFIDATTDNGDALVALLNITTVPTVLVIRAGKEVHRMAGISNWSPDTVRARLAE